MIPSISFIFSILLSCVYSVRFDSEKSNQFYIKNTLKDGVRETLLSVNKFFGKEIFVGPKEGSHNGIVVRQLSNGRQVVTLIYNGIPPTLAEFEGTSTSSLAKDLPPPIIPPEEDDDQLLLRECKVDKQADDVNNFIEAFTLEAKESGRVADGSSNSTKIAQSEVVLLDRSLANLPYQLLYLSRFSHFKSQCFELRRRIRREVKLNRNAERPHRGDARKRSKRATTSIFNMPNTKWCGSGQRAKRYSDLGGLHGADMCCRQHDHCPYHIEAFTSKYGHFHFGLSTLSHCSCDRRFKTCLKHIGTGASDVVGNVFFNLVKAKCFVFERKRVCRKGNFWRCYKYGYEKQAVVKEPTPWHW